MGLNIEFLRSRLPGRGLHFFDTIDTTMREAASLAAAGAPSGTAVIAEEQTAGQGRHGHTWHSEKAHGLYVSIVLRPDLPKDAASALTLALGLATLDAISAATGLTCDLRWPNDVMINNKKCAGILAQLLESAAIAGIGINVNHPRLPVDLFDEATSLRLESGVEQSRERVLIELLPAVDRHVAILAEAGPGHILAEFARR